MKKTVKRSDCPISRSLDILGDKWTLLILRDLLLRDFHFYSEFLNSDEKIATNILSDRLKMLEEKEILVSKPYEKLKTKKEYRVTKKGISLVPMILEMLIWGLQFDKSTIANPDVVQKYMNNRNGLIFETTESLEKSNGLDFC
jgi:DNA-binding HxlR family transcriptional regulator